MMIPLRAADALVRIWTCLYTWRLPAALRERRRAEIESDLWESLHDDQTRSEFALAVHIVLRLMAGIPDDLFWRFEQPRESTRSPRRAMKFALATIATILLAAVWLSATFVGGELPVPPAAPSARFAFPDLTPLPLPPPPPPPPPRGIWPGGGQLVTPPSPPPPVDLGHK